LLRVADMKAIGDELGSIGVIQKDLLRSRTEQDVARILSDALTHHFGAFFARVWLTRPGDVCDRCQLADHCPDKRMCLHLVASSGFYTHLDGAHARVPLGAFKIGLIAQGRGKTISNDVPHDERVHDRDWAKQHDLQAFAGFPIVQDNRVVGVMAMFSQSTLPEHLLTTLELLADLAASALENARHFRLEAELVQARKLESVGQLAAGVAHEINSPMQFIGDNIEFIGECSERLFELLQVYERNLSEADNPKEWGQRRREIATITKESRFEHIAGQMPAAIAESREGVRRVIDIVRAMRQFSHPGTNEMADTDLNEAIRNTLIITKNRWKGVADVETELDPALPLVPALAAGISQVLLNLVVNAADAIAEKLGDDPDDKGRISVRSRCDADYVTVEFEDTGCGIRENIRSRVFDPFFTTKEVGKGTGQGLSICHDVVVNKHGGEIELESTLGKGSCFRVKLPRVVARKDLDHSSDEEAFGEKVSAAGDAKETRSIPIASRGSCSPAQAEHAVALVENK